LAQVKPTLVEDMPIRVIDPQVQNGVEAHDQLVHERSGEVWRNSRYFVEVNHIPVKGLDVPVIHLQIESNPTASAFR
jgi:hypothetical protein